MDEIHENEDDKKAFNDHHTTWDECDSNGDVEEDYEPKRMALMAIGDLEVSSSQSSHNECDSDYDDCSDDEFDNFILKLHVVLFWDKYS